MKHLFLPVVFALTLATAAPAAAVDTYVFDPAHSSVAFSIRHFLAQVPGQFAKVTGQIEVDPTDFTRNTVSATVEVASVATLNEKRDEHLRTADFFNAAAHPTATFTSTRWSRTGPDTYAVTGDFTLHGVTKELTLQVKYLGQADGNRGARLSGWQATVTLKRADFGIGKPERSIGENAAITINVEARLQKPEAKSP